MCIQDSHTAEGVAIPKRNRRPDFLYSCFKNYFSICFSFPLDQQGKNVNLNSWGKLNPSHTSFFLFLLLIEFNEQVRQSTVIKANANGYIRMACGTALMLNPEKAAHYLYCFLMLQTVVFFSLPSQHKSRAYWLGTCIF